jgi:hypothetical protein
MHKILFVFLLTVSVGIAATVSIPDISGGAGSTVEIPLNIDDPSGIAGFQFTLSFDSNVLQATGVSSGTLTEGWLAYINTDTDGQAGIVFLNPLVEELGETSGSLAKIIFLVTGDVDDTTSFLLSEVSFYNALAEGIGVGLQTGTFTVDVQTGDVNNDQSTNISDVILCLRVAIGLPVTIGDTTYSASDPGGYPLWLLSRGDMNGDSYVNISDVILILRKSIGL